jgi:hypothetical protein
LPANCTTCAEFAVDMPATPSGEFREIEQWKMRSGFDLRAVRTDPMRL